MNFVTFAARNALRNRVRTGLTVLGVSVAVVTFVLLRTVVTSWNSASDAAAKDRIATRNRVSFFTPLPVRYVERIRELGGVAQATAVSWFGGRDPNRPESYFANYLVEPGSFLEVYDEIGLSADEKQRWLEDRQGAVIGSSLAKQLGLKVGDRFTLQGAMYAGDWPLNIVGIYTTTRKSFNLSSMMFHYDYVNETLPPSRRDQVGWVVSRVAEAGRGPEISRTIDRVFDEYDNQTTTMSERQITLEILGMVSATLQAFDMVSAIILMILLMILANTIAMSARERTNEYGALRALGFTPAHIRWFILGESITTGMVAGVLGLALAFPLIDGAMSAFIEENMGGLFPYFRIAPSTAVTALILAATLGAVAGLVPALAAGRLSVVDALRRVE